MFPPRLSRIRGAAKDFHLWSYSYTMTNKVFPASHFGRRRSPDFIQNGRRQGETGLPVFSKGRKLPQVSGQPGAPAPHQSAGGPENPAGTSTFIVNGPPEAAGTRRRRENAPMSTRADAEIIIFIDGYFAAHGACFSWTSADYVTL